jgi:FKBP-type peptidyl-prolyl cis-trans isomerase SlyD
MSLTVGNEVVVSMHYTLSNSQGDTIDSSVGGKPLGYLHGAGNIIPGLEKALVGKAVGDKLQVTVEPKEGYGEKNPQLMQTLNRSLFQGVATVEVGMKFQAQAPDGTTQHLVVTDVDGEDITIDANHPLAGETLFFDVEIVSVRKATEEELAHGHVH